MASAVIGVGPSTDLPSHRFCMSTWTDLDAEKGALNVNQLNSPRIRRGPEEDVEERMLDKYEVDSRTTHQIYGRHKRDHRLASENWEDVVICNLSYQELQDEYQSSIFIQILKRLKRAKEAYFMHNKLVDISSANLQSCEILDVSTNSLMSFRCLPTLRNAKWINISCNNIQTLDGLKSLQGARELEYLDLRRNPVTFTTDNYRFKVFKTLPQLRYLDGVVKTPRDETPTEETYGPPKDNRCVLM